MRSHWIVSLLVASTLALAPAAQAGICFFGYADAYIPFDPNPLERFDSSLTQVQTSGGRVLIQDPNDYVVDDVDYILARSGRVLLDLTDLIFNPNVQSGINCTHYERGTASDSALFYKFRGGYQSNLSTFLSLNAPLFTGNDKVLGVVIHSEANNGCVETWKLASAASYLRNTLGLDPAIRIIVGYGLSNTPGYVDNGLPWNPSTQSLGSFPTDVDTISYFAYDIYDPGNPWDSRNKGIEPWNVVWGKVQSILGGRDAIGVLNAFCNQSLHRDKLGWVTNCPNQKVWPLGYVARNWKNWWLTEPNHIGAIAWLWGSPTPSGTWGTRSLASSFVRSEHQAINNSLNCSLPVIP